MTTLARIPLAPGSMSEHRIDSHTDAHLLLARLHEESDRQVPFSQAKLLLREAASTIERLERELVRITAEVEGERASRRAP